MEFFGFQHNLNISQVDADMEYWQDSKGLKVVDFYRFSQLILT
jgi:hypothetical protein